MAVAFVTYDLHRPGQAWPQMDAALKALGGERALETFWFFPPAITVDHVVAAVQRVTDANDKWFVGTAKSPATWALTPAWTSWLQAKL